MRDELLRHLRFRPISAGRFLLGSPATEPGRDECEGPQRQVFVPGFWLSETVVTNACWRLYAQATGAAPPRSTALGWTLDNPRQPLVGLDLSEVLAFCTWAGARLPTDTEWEFACRAGTTTAYWSGDSEEDLARVGWYAGNSEALQLPEVAQKPANPKGLHDMHGGVWEWCASLFTPEGHPALPAWSSQASPPASPESLLSGQVVIRGGAWLYPPRAARSAFRTYALPTTPNPVTGFRCIADPTAATL